MRRIRALLRGLPPESNVARIFEPEAADWNLQVEMLASLCEVIDATSWRSVMPHARKGWKPPKPLKIRRPWEPKVPERKGITMGEFKAMFGPAAVRTVTTTTTETTIEVESDEARALREARDELDREIPDPTEPVVIPLPWDDGTYRDSAGRLRDARGRFVKGRENR